MELKQVLGNRIAVEFPRAQEQTLGSEGLILAPVTEGDAMTMSSNDLKAKVIAVGTGPEVQGLLPDDVVYLDRRKGAQYKDKQFAIYGIEAVIGSVPGPHHTPAVPEGVIDPPAANVVTLAAEAAALFLGI